MDEWIWENVQCAQASHSKLELAALYFFYLLDHFTKFDKWYGVPKLLRNFSAMVTVFDIIASYSWIYCHDIDSLKEKT